MKNLHTNLKIDDIAKRQATIVSVFEKNFGTNMTENPKAWRSKFRKMSSTPFAFYRGSASLFFKDMEALNDQSYLNERTSNVWIHGDLHAENFGTYMDGEGKLVFAVNDFDEAWVAPFTWDLKRLAASLALIGFQKALSDDEIKKVIATCVESYVQQVENFAKENENAETSLTLENTSGKILEVLLNARLSSRIGLLEEFTEIKDYDRRFKTNKVSLPIKARERKSVERAFKKYLKTIPKRKVLDDTNYGIKDIVEIKGTGIGSAGFKLYSILLEGPNEALENDIIISMKVGQTPSASRVTKNDRVHNYFKNNGHRTFLSQMALQSHAGKWLGYTDINKAGYFVTEFSPYDSDLEWGEVNSMEDICEVVTFLGKAVAKIHCVSDEDSDQDLVPFSTDQALHDVLAGKEEDFVEKITTFGLEYGTIVRNDYQLFVDLFRNKHFKMLSE